MPTIAEQILSGQPTVKPSAQPIDKRTAEQDLLEDAQAAEDAARRVVPNFSKLDRERQAVLVNMAYNLGPSGLAEFNSTIGAVGKGDFDAAADSMLKSKWAKQTGPRAKRLAERMRKGGGEGDGPIHEYELAQLRQDEGFSETPYTDTTGNTTVGYGRNLSARGESAEPDLLQIKGGNLLDQTGKKDLLGMSQQGIPNASEQVPPSSVTAGTSFAELSLGTGEAPVRPKATGFMNKAKDAIDQFVEEAWKAIPRTEEQSKYKLREYGKLMTAGVPHGTIARGIAYANRETMGIPMSAEEERSIANAFAIAKPELGDTKEFKKYITQTFKHGGASKEEWEATARGTWNIATAPLFMLGPTGVAARAGITGLRTVVPNILSRHVIAAELHSIASFVVYEVGLAAIEGEDKSDAAIRGGLIGAFAPPVLFVAGTVAKVITKGAIKGTAGAVKGVAKPSVRLADWGLKQVHLYNYTRRVLDAFHYTWDRGWGIGLGRSGAGVLKKFGLEDTLVAHEAMRKESYLQGAQWVVKAQNAVWKMSKKDRVVMMRILNSPREAWGKVAAQAENPQRTMMAAAKIDGLFKEVSPLAQKYEVLVAAASKRHLRVFAPRQDFGAPHVFKNTKQFVEPGAIQEEAIAVLLKNPKVRSRKRALEILEGIHKRNTSRMKDNDYDGLGHVNLEGRKWNLPGYIDDPNEFLPDYFMRMAREITQAKYFGDLQTVMKGQPGINFEAVGPNGVEKIFHLPTKGIKSKYPKAFAEVTAKFGPGKSRDKDLVETIIDRQLGGIDMGNPVQQFLGDQAQYQAVMKLGLSQLTQLTQFGVGTVPLGYRAAFSNLLKFLGRDKGVHELALKSAATLPALIRENELALIGGSRAAAMKGLKRIGFTYMDTEARAINAQLGASTAQYQADDLVLLLERRWKAKGLEKKYIESQIKKIDRKFQLLDIDVNDVIANNGKLTENQILGAAQKISTDMNFWGDSLSLPAFYKSPNGKFMTQFKSYSYQQGIMLKNHVLKPALEEGEIGPLVRLLINMEVSGEVIEDVKSWIKGTERPQGLERALENLLTGGGFSLLYDAWRATNYTGGLVSMAIGPLLSDYAVAAEAIVGGKGKLAQQRLLAAVGPMFSMLPGPVGKALFWTPVATPRAMNELKKKQKENR